MSRYLLDTNICVHFLKNEYDVKKKIAQVGLRACFLSEITIAELLFGVENSAPERRQRNRDNLADFQTLFSGRIIGIGNVLPEYARQKAALKRAGRAVGEFDLLIGATALVHDHILVTRNTRHFTDLMGIKLENWIDL